MYSKITGEKVAQLLEVDVKVGLTEEQVAERRKVFGENRLEKQKEKSMLVKMAYQFSDPMVIILLVAAAVSFFTEFLNGKADFTDPLIILAIVALNAGIGIFQERKAEKALDALEEMMSPTASVRRNGKVVKIPAELLLPGDILIIESGDIIPADCRLIKSTGLTTDESALTGESHSVHKNAEAICKENAGIGDKLNMVWSATTVFSGRGEAVVIATGMSTEVGRIAGILNSEAAPKTPLQQKLAKTGQTLGITALAVCGVIFVLGLIRAIPPMEIFLTAVSLAVAAIPEGLPAIVTIMLALGVQRMADNCAVVRRLSAVETLGSASVICSDKTGTITQNRMKVMRWWGDEKSICLCAALCSNGIGQTERALINGAGEKGFLKKEWEERYPRISEEPFDSAKKWMGTVNRFPSGNRCFIKGAPDAVIEKCSLSAEERKLIMKRNHEMASEALRVIAFAEGEGGEFKEMKFSGLAGLSDPPRPEVKEAVKTCRNAGLKVVMITGDHEDTAAAVARKVGLIGEGEEASAAISGKELDAMTDEQLRKRVRDCSVFARVTPKDKVRIVKAFQQRGDIVAMTGDGVNDAPALKAADIGCAMGINGTDVARGAADMVLADDNFATIVTAVKEGRGIYDNIKKAVHFLLSSNIGEIITIFVAILLGWNSPLLPVQLLWINLITDSFPAIALGVDPADEKIMCREPVKKNKSLFADGMSGNILVEGILIGALALFAFAVGYNVYHSQEVARTMSFTVLGLSQLVHAFNVRSEERSVFDTGIFSNMYLTGAFFLCCGLQVAVISVPALAEIFKVVQLSAAQWGITALLSIFPLAFVELEKFVFRRIGRKKLR